MYCKKCLGTIEADEKFCTSCGTPVEGRDIEELNGVKESTKEVEKLENLKETQVVEELKAAENGNFGNAIDGLELKEENLKAKTPIIHLDPKTGESIMPEELEDITLDTHKEIKTTVPPIKVEEAQVKNPQVQSQKQEVYSGPNVYKKAPTSSKPSPGGKVVDKSGEFIIGIIGVVLSFLTSLVSAIIYVGFGAIGMFAETTDTVTSGNSLLIVLMVILGLKGFVFAVLGLIGVLNVKKNSKVAGLFFLSAAVGSILSIQLIRGGFFVAAGVICLTRHEKVEGPILKYVLAAFIPTIVILLLVLINFIVLVISGDVSTIEDVNSVYIMIRDFV